MIRNNRTTAYISKFRLQYKAELFLLFTAIFWGLSFPLIKIGLIYVSPFAFVFYRFLITTIIFIIIFRKKLPGIKFKELKYGFILGIYLYIGFITQTIGLKYTTAANSAFITGTNIVLIPFVQILLVKTKPKIENIIGIIIVVIGLFFLTEIKNANFNYGDFITLFCAISFAIYIVLLDKYYKKTGYFELIYGQFITMVFLCLFGMFFIEYLILDEYYFELNFESSFTLIFTSLLATLLGLYIAIKYQKFTTPVRAGLIYNMEQIFAVIFAYFIINELLSFNQLIGAIIMFTGLLISEFFGEFKSFIKK